MSKMSYRGQIKNTLKQIKKEQESKLRFAVLRTTFIETFWTFTKLKLYVFQKTRCIHPSWQRLDEFIIKHGKKVSLNAKPQIHGRILEGSPIFKIEDRS